MGKDLKRFTARTVAGPATDEGIVDLAAAVTMLKPRLARRLGLRPEIAVRPDSITAGGETLIGYRMPVCIEVDGQEACVDAFAPLGKKTGAGEEPFEIANNVIGADFLRVAKPKPKGKPTFEVGGGFLEFRKLTPEEREALRQAPPRCKAGRSRKGSR